LFVMLHIQFNLQLMMPRQMGVYNFTVSPTGCAENAGP